MPQLGVQEGLLEEGVSKLGPKGREDPAGPLGWVGAHPHSTPLTWWTLLPGFSLRLKSFSTPEVASLRALCGGCIS